MKIMHAYLENSYICKNVRQMTLLMSFFFKLHPLKTRSLKNLRDYCNFIHALCNAIGLSSLGCTIMVEIAKLYILVRPRPVKIKLYFLKTDNKTT